MDKIKQYLYGAYAAVVAVLLAALYYLSTKNKNLEQKSSEIKSELGVRNQLMQLAAQKEKGDVSEDDYRALRDKYLKQSGSSSGGDTET